jgi:hypothetical protein
MLNEMASGRFQQRTPNRRPKPFKGTKFCQLKASSPKERNAALPIQCGLTVDPP